MDYLTRLRKTILIPALLSLTVTAEAGTRNFFLKIENKFSEPINVTAVDGNGRFQGTTGVFALLPNDPRDFVLQFDNRSSVGWHDGLVRYDFDDVRLGGKGSISVWFDRGGVISGVHYNPGSIPVAVGGSKKVGPVNMAISQSIPFNGPPTWGGGPASDHYYTLTLSPTAKRLEANQKLIVEFTNEGGTFRESQNKNLEEQSAYEKMQSAGITVEASYQANAKTPLGGSEARGSVSVNAQASQTTTGSVGTQVNTETSVERRLEEGKMRIMVVNVDIMQAHDGKVYVETLGQPAPIIITDLARMYGSYTIVPSLGYVSGVRLVNSWPNSKLQKIVGDTAKLSIRPGVYNGVWEETAMITIDKVEDNGTFMGKATHTKGANKGYVISFEGTLLPDQSIVLNRTDKWQGKTIVQKCSAPTPELVNNVYTWKGSGSDSTTNTTFPFELQMSGK